VAVEFKYDRGNPGGANQNRTQRAAAVVNDLFRLVKLPSSVASVKYFVYVTDAEMARYFKNPANRLADLFELSGTTRYALSASAFQGFSQTFVTRIASLASDCQVGSVWAAELPLNHQLRVFEVLTAA
jgi:hypothetical protein